MDPCPEGLRTGDRALANLRGSENTLRADLEKKELTETQQAMPTTFLRSRNVIPGFSCLAGKYRLAAKSSDLFRYNQAVGDLGSGQTFQNLAFQLRLNEVGFL